MNALFRLLENYQKGQTEVPLHDSLTGKELIATADIPEDGLPHPDGDGALSEVREVEEEGSEAG
eukprot:15434170-Alexandrium_andersonii.AAC.1